MNPVLSCDHPDADLRRVTCEENPAGPGYRICFLQKGAGFSMSDVLPFLNDAGLRVQTHTAEIQHHRDGHPVHVHAFSGMLCNRQPMTDACRLQTAEGLLHLWNGTLGSGLLNRLLAEEGWTWRKVGLLQAMVDYLRQLRPAWDRTLIETTLLDHPERLALWMQMFENRFRPDASQNPPCPLEDPALSPLLVADQAGELWTALFRTLHIMVRTTFWQTTPDGKPKLHTAFKLDHTRDRGGPSHGIRFEVFVHAPHMQGIHFRAGLTARGGIRWSDRPGDFRREALDLARTQTLKNAIIVPTGAKGAFVVTNGSSSDTPSMRLEKGQRAYRTLIHGLLDLTDNRVVAIHGDAPRILPPPGTVCLDGPDSYLVVAADKGTAAFSDIANAIALERGFWLGDAFASGGSAGYNHKTLGITSAGAWESLKAHRHDAGLLPSHSLTVVGVGDMSGDVFGNGMLGSDTLKLLAAFDHRHIFLDPDPDPAVSFRERQRLFRMAGSSWQDYTPALISRGGGVFDRSAPLLSLSPEAGKVFGLSSVTLSPVELIRAILRAPVDVLWFGGIGTFVRGSMEDELASGDTANQFVRVRGDEVKARMIVEGANLGCTQAGRIQYARTGGRINTDAVDNSAGVTCSDYEVNLKILVDQAVHGGRLSREERNAFLQNMTPQVVQAVLRQNIQANRMLSFAVHDCRNTPEPFVRLRSVLKALRRRGQDLPRLSSERTIREHGLTRPELCVIMAHCKAGLKQCLRDDLSWMTPALENHALHAWFPQAVHDHPALVMAEHPLKTEIVITTWVNAAINRCGPLFLLGDGVRFSPGVLVRRMGPLAQALLQPGMQTLGDHTDTAALDEPPALLFQAFSRFRHAVAALDPSWLPDRTT